MGQTQVRSSSGSNILSGEVFGVLSTTQASRPAPVMTSVQRDAIATSSITFGDMVANSTTTALNYFDGSAWQAVANSKAASYAIASKTGNYPLTNADDVVFGDSSGGTFTLTIPAAASNSGKVFWIKKTDSSFTTITIARSGSDTFQDQTSGLTSTSLDSQGESLFLVSNGSSTWQVLDRRIPSYVVDGGTITLSGSGGTPSKGTTTRDKIYYWRRGHFLGYSIQFRQTTNGNDNSSTNNQILIPASLTADTTQQPTAGTLAFTTIGTGTYWLSSGTLYTVTALLQDSTHIALELRSTNLSFGSWGTAFSGIAASTLEINVNGEIPISGWNG